MVWNVVSIVVLSAWSALVSSQYVPASPCPDTFSYNVADENIYGLIRYQPPGSTKYIFMRATFVIKAELPSNYTGELEVQGARAFVLLRMLRGQSLDYRVDFPLPSPLPTLAAITVNGDVLCLGERETSSTSKTYSVEHLVFDKGDEDLSIIILGNTENRKPITPSKPIQLSGTGAEVECGLVSGGNEQVELVQRGKAVSPGQWPWLVAIYAKFSKSVNYICAGSLVSNKHVITAAHCMSRLGVVKAKQDFVLKLGAFNLDNADDPQVVTRGITAAAIHFYYDSHTLANDLLVLFLDSPVIFTQFIRPVCLWEGAIDLNGIVNKYGTVVGWGGNELRESGTGEPRMASLPVVSTESCRGTRKEFHDLTSRTTICAGGRNGTGPCNGDSGGGLYMLSEGRWRLRGLVSVSLRRATGEAKCNLQEYVVFTDVAQYLSWVRTQLAGMPVPSQGPNPPTTSSKRPPAAAVDVPCGVLSGGNDRVHQGNSASPTDWPWLVAIYQQFSYSCAGSLISSRHVITSYLCLDYRTEKDLKRARVLVGAFSLQGYTDPPNEEFGVVFANIKHTALHDSFHKSAPLVNDVRIMTLDEPVIFSERVRPVCLWEGDTNHELIVGQSAMAVGWGHTRDYKVVGSGPPRADSVPLVPREACGATSRRLCGGYRNGTGVYYNCYPHFGSGLYMLSGGRWRLRGLVSGSCRNNEYNDYTDVAPFVSWIRQYMKDNT